MSELSYNSFLNQIHHIHAELLDPFSPAQPIDLRTVPKNIALRFLEQLVSIRAAEQKLAREKELGNLHGPVHLAIGQEAVPVGISKHITKDDFVFGGHRSHGHLLALGANLENFFLEILGKKNGLCAGIGGSMHLQDMQSRFFGSVPIVAGTVPLALGAAFAAKMDQKSGLAVAYMGDGAVEEGVVHESLNIASVMKLPIIFVVENNLFASHMNITERQPSHFVARYAAANNVPFEIVDGNDVMAVSAAFELMSKQTRESCKPGFIEAITYRWLGHVDWREDVDVGVSRDKANIDAWKVKDPIKRLYNAMEAERLIDPSEYNKIKIEIYDGVNSLWNKCLEQPETDFAQQTPTVFFE